MECIVLSAEETRQTGFTHKITCGKADFAATDTDPTKRLAIFPQTGNLAAGTGVVRCGFKITTNWTCSDGDVSSIAVEIGDEADPDRYSVSKELLESATEIEYWLSNATTLPYVYTAADTIDALFTMTGGASPDIAEITAGEIAIYLGIVDLTKI